MLIVSVYTPDGEKNLEQWPWEEVEITVTPSGTSRSQQAQNQESESGKTSSKGIVAFNLAPGEYTVEIGELPANDRWTCHVDQDSQSAMVNPDTPAVAWFVVRFKVHYPKIHFVWFGTGNPSPQNTATPKEILRNICAATVNYWCLERKVSDFSSALPGVEVRSIESLVKKVDTNLRNDLQGILDFYLEHKVYAPGKDLVTFAVLASEGGYFFDANCTFANYSSLRAEIYEGDREWPAFIALQRESKLDYADVDPTIYTIDEFQALTMPLLLEFTRGATIHKFDETDMWAMYAPPDSSGKNSVFWVIVEQYIKRAKRAGLLTKPENRTEGQKDFCADLAGLPHEEDEKEVTKGHLDTRKRTAAGALGTQSILAAMHALRKMDKYDEKKANFPTITTGGESYKIKSLGLMKAHGHSW
jgi:hypothetical protein